MSELAIAPETDKTRDPAGQRAGVQAAIVAVFLTLSAIASLRTHTEGILLTAQANDRWQYYQSRRLRFHNLQMGEDLMLAMGARGEVAARILERYRSEQERYQKESREAQAEARRTENEAKITETRARHFDYSEGLLEVGLVLTSLYFISRKALFTGFGLAASISGIVVALRGLMI